MAEINLRISGWSTLRMPILAPAPHAALLDDIGGGIESADEGDRAAGDAAGGTDPVLFRSQAGEGKAGAAAALMNQGGIFDGIENRFHGVFDRQDETGGKLSQFPAGVHQGGGVGQEFQLVTMTW